MVLPLGTTSWPQPPTPRLAKEATKMIRIIREAQPNIKHISHTTAHGCAAIPVEG